MLNKQVFLWGLYDFANSILIGNMSLYFVQFIVVEKGVADIFFSLTLAISSVLLVFLAPNIGILIDKGIRKIQLIRILSIFILIGGVLLGLLQNVFFLLFLFLLANLAYQLSMVPYNYALVDIAKEKRRGFVSGFGEFSNYAGYLIGLLITLPIISGNFQLFGAGRQGTFIPAALLFLILGLPFLIFHKGKPRKKVNKIKFNPFREFLNTFKLVKERKYRGIFIFLIIFLLANNAAVTFITFTPLYFEVVEKFSDQIKVLFTTIAFSAAAIGAIVGGKLTDKYDSYKILSIVVAAWATSLALVILGSGFWYILPFVIIIGFLMGSFWAIGRKLFIEIVSPKELGRFFGLYALSIRLSGFLGPPIWSFVAIMFLRWGDDRYKFSMLSLALLLLLSFAFLRTWKSRLKTEEVI